MYDIRYENPRRDGFRHLGKREAEASNQTPVVDRRSRGRQIERWKDGLEVELQRIGTIGKETRDRRERE